MLTQRWSQVRGQRQPVVEPWLEPESRSQSLHPWPWQCCVSCCASPRLSPSFLLPPRLVERGKNWSASACNCSPWDHSPGWWHPGCWRALTACLAPTMHWELSMCAIQSPWRPCGGAAGCKPPRAEFPLSPSSVMPWHIEGLTHT